MTNPIDPRTAAEIRLYDIAAHKMHEKACSDAYDRPHSRLCSQWNDTFTGWVRTAEYRRLDIAKMGRSEHIRYNRDGSIQEKISY